MMFTAEMTTTNDLVESATKGVIKCSNGYICLSSLATVFGAHGKTFRSAGKRVLGVLLTDHRFPGAPTPSKAIAPENVVAALQLLIDDGTIRGGKMTPELISYGLEIILMEFKLAMKTGEQPKHIVLSRERHEELTSTLSDYQSRFKGKRKGKKSDRKKKAKRRRRSVGSDSDNESGIDSDLPDLATFAAMVKDRPESEMNLLKAYLDTAKARAQAQQLAATVAIQATTARIEAAKEDEDKKEKKKKKEPAWKAARRELDGATDARSFYDGLYKLMLALLEDAHTKVEDDSLVLGQLVNVARLPHFIQSVRGRQMPPGLLDAKRSFFEMQAESLSEWTACAQLQHFKRFPSLRALDIFWCVNRGNIYMTIHIVPSYSKTRLPPFRHELFGNELIEG